MNKTRKTTRKTSKTTIIRRVASSLFVLLCVVVLAGPCNAGTLISLAFYVGSRKGIWNLVWDIVLGTEFISLIYLALYVGSRKWNWNIVCVVVVGT